MNKTLVIVPTYNREGQSAAARGTIVAPPRARLNSSWRLTTPRWQPANSPMTSPPGIPSSTYLHRAQKQGLGRAYCAGFAWALAHDYEFIMEMDATSRTSRRHPQIHRSACEADLVLGPATKNGIRVINWPLRA